MDTARHVRFSNYRQHAPPVFSREIPLIFTRSHWLIPTQTILALTFFFFPLLLIGITGIFYLRFLSSVFLLFVLLLVSVFMASTIKILADWYFHYYIITKRAISEVSYIPLSTHYVNEVLLDRVKCTEVDIKTDGIINKMLDIGSVTVTFDRPTHQDAFVFADVANATEIGSLLSGKFAVEYEQKETTVWHRGQNKGYYTTEEIIPRLQL